MKILIIILFPLLSLANYQGSNPQKVWNQIKSDEYTDIPTEKITAAKIYDKISERAQDTISNKNDIIPYFNKLLHSNGICLLGLWEIEQDNPYSGYFKKSSRAIVIARASTTLSGVKRGEKRGFAMALKLYPTDNFNTNKRLKTANIFTIDTLAGNNLSHFMKSEMTNMPKFGFTLDAFLGLIVGKSFLLADNFPMVRQVYQVSELGEKNLSNIKTPRFFKIQAAPNQILSEESDFRDELIDALWLNSRLIFDISVTKKNKYQKIGSVTFTEAIASESCDHKLHFNHPKFRFDLEH